MKAHKMTIITLKCNLQNNMLPPGQFKLVPKMNRSIRKINDMVYFVDLGVQIQNTAETPFPTNVEVSIRGIFEFNEVYDDLEIMDYMKKDAVDFVYPYLRSMVSSLAATAMFPPIMLPIMKAEDIFKDNSSEIVN